MTQFDPSEYGILIRRQQLDGHWYFVGRALEFPDVEVFEESYEVAHESLLGIISTLKAAADRNGKPFPVPALPKDEQDEDYSGRVTLRLTKSLHRKAVQLARDEMVSLNQLLLAVIAEAVGEKSAAPSQPMVVHHVIGMQTAVATTDVGAQKLIVVGTLQDQSVALQ